MRILNNLGLKTYLDELVLKSKSHLWEIVFECNYLLKVVKSEIYSALAGLRVLLRNLTLFKLKSKTSFTAYGLE
jgi:hypothetical protein